MRASALVDLCKSRRQVGDLRACTCLSVSRLVAPRRASSRLDAAASAWLPRRYISRCTFNTKSPHKSPHRPHWDARGGQGGARGGAAARTAGRARGGRGAALVSAARRDSGRREAGCTSLSGCVAAQAAQGLLLVPLFNKNLSTQRDAELPTPARAHSRARSYRIRLAG